MNTTTGPGDGAGPDAITPLDSIRTGVAGGLKTGTNSGRVQTRFPPGPNGYLHFGHAMSICLNIGVALEDGRKCNLRYDDTNPAKEDVEHVDAAREFARRIGVAKREGLLGVALLEGAVRSGLNRLAPRAVIVPRRMTGCQGLPAGAGRPRPFQPTRL